MRKNQMAQAQTFEEIFAAELKEIASRRQFIHGAESSSTPGISPVGLPPVDSAANTPPGKSAEQNRPESSGAGLDQSAKCNCQFCRF